MALRHLYEILALLENVDAGCEFEHFDLPVKAVLDIENKFSEGWVISADPGTDPHWGCIDAEEFDDVLDKRFIKHGPCVTMYKGYLWVLAGEWRYPIYFRFEREKTELVKFLESEFEKKLALDEFAERLAA